MKEEEEDFFNHCKNDIKRHVHTLSVDAGTDLKSRSGGVQKTKDSHPPTAQPPSDVHETPTQA